MASLPSALNRRTALRAVVGLLLLAGFVAVIHSTEPSSAVQAGDEAAADQLDRGTGPADPLPFTTDPAPADATTAPAGTDTTTTSTAGSGGTEPGADGATGARRKSTSTTMKTAWKLGQRPFVSSSSWNTPIPTGATYTDLHLAPASGGNYWVDWEEYSVAVWFSRPSDPAVKVSHPSGWGNPAGDTVIHLPAGVTGAAGTDGSIVVIDGTTAYNMWRFDRTSDTTATCEAIAWADVTTGTGWGTLNPLRGAGITGAGSNQLAGLLVQAETDAGEIRHALELSVESTLNMPGMTGEAIHYDGQSPTGILKEGQRLAIPRSTPMPAGLSPLGQKVFRALQTYGAFDVDSSGGSTTLRAQSNAYGQSTISALRDDMKLMGPLLQAVNM